MKRFCTLIFFMLPFALCSCMNGHADFCKQASEKLCAKCTACGGYGQCGFTDVTDETSCKEKLFRICEAYEPDFNREVARNCLSELDATTCAAPKPEVCSRLF